MRRDSVLNTFFVALVLCVVCSVVVSGAAVFLRPEQQENKRRDRQKNILSVAGLDAKNNDEIATIFKTRIRSQIIDVNQGAVTENAELSEAGIDPTNYDQRSAANNPELSVPINSGELPGISRREKYSYVYQVLDDSGTKVEQVILPIYGKGLWSTLYGFIALDADGMTIRGITFYEHGETPGLGGEVENPAWKALWNGKLAYDSKNGEREVAIEVIKGAVTDHDPDAEHKVDGLSGATITSRGVTGMLEYWLGPQGFEPYLTKKPWKTKGSDG